MNGIQVSQTRRHAAEEDGIWIRETLAGRDDAFACLVEKYKDLLFELASRILRNRAEAEDILQDAFIQAYRHLGDFRNDSRFSTWLYSIVLNRIRNKMRRNKVLRWCSLDVRRVDRDDAYIPELPHRGPSLDTLTEEKMEIETVERMVNSFPLHYQSVFIMHYFHHFSLEEVSRRLGRPLGTVKVYLHRARKLLYKRLIAEGSAASLARRKPFLAAPLGATRPVLST